MVPQNYRLIAFWIYIGRGDVASGECDEVALDASAVIGWNNDGDDELYPTVVGCGGSSPVAEFLHPFNYAEKTGYMVLRYTTTREGSPEFLADRCKAEERLRQQKAEWAQDRKGNP